MIINGHLSDYLTLTSPTCLYPSICSGSQEALLEDCPRMHWVRGKGTPWTDLQRHSKQQNTYTLTFLMKKENIMRKYFFI